MDSIIKVEHVSKKFKLYFDRPLTLKERIVKGSKGAYKEFYALKDVSFEIKRGSTVGLIGQNGSGKSTMLKIINRTMFPDSGKVTINGKVASLIELGAGFHPELSGRENIYTNATIFGFTKDQIDEKIPEIIRFSELEDFIDNPVRTYSSGMYARLAFSVAINVEADVLLVDEILGVGDMNFQAKCADRIYEMRKKGTTIVVVTHDMGTIDRLCDYGIWLDHGIKIDEGEPQYIEDAYLAYMESKKEERKKEENEEKLENQETATSEEKAAVKVDEQEKKNDRITITELGDHIGNGNILVDRCKLMDDKGIDKRSFHSGDAMTFQFHYICQKDFDWQNVNLNFGFEISTAQGTYIYGTNTSRDGIKNVKAKPEGNVVVEFKNLALLPGDYTIGVGIANEEETINYDNYHIIQKFRVFSTGRDVGITRIEHEYRIE